MTTYITAHLRKWPVKHRSHNGELNSCKTSITQVAGSAPRLNPISRSRYTIISGWETFRPRSFLSDRPGKRSIPPGLGQHGFNTSPAQSRCSVKASLDYNPARFDNSTPSTAWNQSPPMTRRNESLWNLGPGMKSGPDSSLSCRMRPKAYQGPNLMKTSLISWKLT